MSGSAMARAGVAFSLVTAFTLDRPWLETETGLLGLSIGVQGIAAYAARHTYNFQPVFTRPSDDEHINWARVRKTVQLFTGQGSNLMCQSDWVVWVESDTWITNQHILLENIVALANDSNPDFAAIVNRDYAGNLNTGVAFIRCSHEGLVLMHALLQCKEQNRTHHLVKAWDHNGCMMLLHGNPRYRDLMLLFPQRHAMLIQSLTTHKDLQVRAMAAIVTKGFGSQVILLLILRGHKTRAKPCLTFCKTSQSQAGCAKLVSTSWSCFMKRN